MVVENPAVSIGLSENVHSDVHENPAAVSKGLPEDVDSDVLKNGAVLEDVNSDDVKQSSSAEDPKSSQESIKKNLIEERSLASGNESANRSRSDLSQDAKLNATKSQETKM